MGVAMSSRALHVALTATALVSGIILAGCARQDGGTDAAGAPSLTVTTRGTTPSHTSTAAPTSSTDRPTSSTEAPTLKPPSGPPKTPTDDLPTDIVVGTIVAANSPCFQLVDDEGRNYALYGTGTPAVTKGDTVRVKVTELTLKIDCGPGQEARIVSLDVIG